MLKMDETKLQFLQQNMSSMKMQDIAAVTGISIRVLFDYKNRIKCGSIDSSHFRQQSERENQIKKYIIDHIESKPLHKIADDLHLSISTISKYKKKYNISKSPRYNKYYFKTIDNEHKAYWLGFIMADGCVHYDEPKISIHIAHKDIELLLAFAKDIDYKNKIHYGEQTMKKSGYICKYNILSLQSQQMKDDLSRYGCVPQKSLIMNFPTNIPQYLIRHWVRGFFDGDGCICRDGSRGWRVSFVGTEKVLYEIKRLLGWGCSVLPRGKIFNLSTGGKNIIKQLYDYLYKDATLFLNRKHNKFINAMKFYAN